MDVEEGRAEVLTKLNPQFESIRLQGAEERTWRNRFGKETNGFLVLPPGYRKERRLPLLVIQYQFSNKFTTQAQWMTSYPVQHFAEAGFAVLLLNYPRELGWKPGDFAAAALSQAYNPLASMEAAAKGLVDEGIADPDRTGVLGWSFGAFLAEMAITQSNLFRAASAGEGGLNNAGQYWVTGSAAMQRYLDAFFGGPPFGEAYANYRRVAPALNADKVKAPLLREYGSDVGVQSLEFYMALRRLGKPVEQVIYPGAPHVFSLPSHRKASMERNLDWFRFWLQGYEDQAPQKREQYERWRAMRAQ
ncbi:MAG: S9 family peptidase [Candidatus Solibacter usitatus]|nr:S9 family peptidase [Candidatus Solibacter usitatus]